MDMGICYLLGNAGPESFQHGPFLVLFAGTVCELTRGLDRGL